MLRVGLTGGIGTGKSYVLRRLAAAGFQTIDLDAIAHDVIARGGPGHGEVLETFGRRVLDPAGEIDRKALGAIVFADPAARERLNAIVHPLVRQEEGRRAARHGRSPEAVVVTDAALLVEAGVHLRFDRLVVTHCPPAAQLARLRRRDGLDLAAAQARIAAQMPMDEKRRFAHYEIDTSGSFAEVDVASDALAVELRQLARVPRLPAPPPIERALGAIVHGPSRGPRGLTPAAVLRDIAAAGGLELQRLESLLEPPASGPWYRAARLGETPGPETLSAAIVLWTLARSGPDEPFLLAAAASLARLTHREPEEIAGACVFAQACAAVASSGAVDASVKGRWREWSAAGRRWGGADPPPRIEAALRAVAQAPREPAAARQTAVEAGADPDLVGALAGLAVGAPVENAPPALVHAIEGLGRAGES